ncbi:uncharacterized protein UTRI_06328_B [Ustilago trichophora]|uniref:FHA domain-containing protein n=1 Tax=Ustilago trichophora TaxID=86804 RepID=A0A5C3EPH0_9BASI|nr:uncharacterized protein UTRI_06328_B [Ustilago trichophora]
MLNSLRRSFGMSPSSSNIQADYVGNSDVPAGVLSPSNRPNTFVPLRRSNSFTNFFSSSRSSSPVKDNMDQNTAKAFTSPAKASSSGRANEEVKEDPVLAFLVLLDKKGRQKQRYPIQSLTTTMGRAEDNDVRFLVSDVSRYHCTIQIEIEQGQGSDNTKAFLQVLGANGVLLNGTQAFPAPRGPGSYELHTGDSVVVAKRSFIFEFPVPTPSPTQVDIFSSPVKGSAPSDVPHTPAPTNKRRVRMSLVNAAQIDTPARPSAGSSKKLASPAKANTEEREARRANGLQRFMQSANVSPSKVNKKKARQSLTSSTSVAHMFATPVKSCTAMVEPKTAPPKQVSFSLYSNSYSGRLSPVKQMRMMPPLDTMNEEQDGSFRSDHEQLEETEAEAAEEKDNAEPQQDESSEDIVIVEELEQALEQPEGAIAEAELEREPVPVLVPVPVGVDGPSYDVDDEENSENIPPSTSDSGSVASSSPSKSGSPKRAKRRSSFFGRAGPFRGISLGFYAEERSEPEQPAEDAQVPAPEAEMPAGQPEEEFSDASDVEPTPMEEEEIAYERQASPVTRRVSSKPMVLGISKTPSPVKKQHFVGLTPLPRRPRLSLTTRRRVSLRTQTLLRSSEAYADRLFLPPPPPTPSSAGPSGLSKSISMPSNLSAMAPMQPPPVFDTSSSFEADPHKYGEDYQIHQLQEVDFESQLDPALSEEEAEPWMDSEDDEDEVDQSLSVLSPSPQKAPVYNFSPVKTSSLPQFATPQPVSRSHSRRVSMPPAGASGAKPSICAALVRLQISGAGERIVHEAVRKSEDLDTSPYSQQSSPTKARKVVRVSDVGLPATERSMGFDLVQDSAVEQESERIAEALNDLFTAEEEELTDDEMLAEEEEDEEQEQEEIVQISSKAQETPSWPTTAPISALQPPQTPVALNSVRHLFSAASAAPAIPDMHGLASMLQTSSPEKPPQYGTLGDRMRANPEIVELLSPVKTSSKKKAALSSSPIKASPIKASPVKSSPVKSSPVKSSPVKSSPVKGRRGVRRSEAAELLLPLPATPRAIASRPDIPSPAVTPLPESVVVSPLEVAAVQPAFEAELHVTMFDATSMDAENEAIAQAFVQAHETEAPLASEVEEQEQNDEVEQDAEVEPTPIQQIEEETQLEEAAEEEEPVALPKAEEVAQVEVLEGSAEPAQEVEVKIAVDVTEEHAVPSAAPVIVEENDSVASIEEQTPVDSSPYKTRASRRAASVSPTKRTARSASPTKRAARSSPVKRADAAPAAIFAEEPNDKSVVLSAEQVQEEAEAQIKSDEVGPESPSKPTRRTGGRKAKQAAAEAISATLMPEAAPQPSPEKPTRRSKAAAVKKIEVEQVEQEKREESEQEEEEAVQEAPKRATRTRATRAAATVTATTATKPIRATRSRAAKSAAAAMPSSSAGYGDDEASEEDEPAPSTRSKRTTSARTRTATTARIKTTRTTKATTAADESSEAEDEDEDEGEEEGEAPATKTRARSTRAKAAVITTTKGRCKAQANHEEAATSSSATTTRSGRTTRRAAAK